MSLSHISTLTVKVRRALRVRDWSEVVKLGDAWEKEVMTNTIENKTIGDEGITVDFRFIKVHTSN